MNLKTNLIALCIVCTAAICSAQRPAQEKIRPVDESRVKEIAAMLSDAPRGMLPTYRERAVWDSLAAADPKSFKTMVVRADKLLKSGFPAWDNDIYMRIFTHGDTQSGKDLLNRRINWISPLAWAECIENNGKYTDAIRSALEDIMAQETWVYPSSYKKEAAGSMVELSTAAMSANIATVMYMMDDKFPPDFRQKVLDELYRRAFTPVKEALEGKNRNHGWLRGTSNWNSYCLQGITAAALTLIPDKTERARFVAIAERYIRNFVCGFTPDGYCTEGLSYFNMGFSSYMILRENIMQATGGRLDIFRDNPDIANYALYPVNIQMTPGVYPSIADCSSKTLPSSDIIYYMGRVLDMKFDTGSEKMPRLKLSLLKSAVTILPEYDTKADYLSGSSAYDPLRSEFGDAGILTVRNAPGSTVMGAVLKGGHNKEHHNHNDIGSFTLAIGKEKMIEDPGSAPYNKKTFSPERYTIRTLGSYGHPVPRISGKEQVPGRNAAAKVTAKDFSPAKDIYEIDYTSAYKPNLPETEMLRRKFAFSRGDRPSLTVTDEFRFSSPQEFETAIITRGEWKQVDGRTIEISRGGSRLRAVITAPKGGVTISAETVDDNNVSRVKMPVYTRIAVKADKPLREGTLTITYIYDDPQEPK